MRHSITSVAICLTLVSEIYASVATSSTGILRKRDEASEVLDLVNIDRVKNKCPPVKLNSLLNQAALLHSQDQAKTKNMTHVGSDGSKIGDRIGRTGYKFMGIAENIAVGAPDAKGVHNMWMNSPGHRGNILGCQYTEMGVASALADNKDSARYWTQVFAISADYGNSPEPPIPKPAPPQPSTSQQASIQTAGSRPTRTRRPRTKPTATKPASSSGPASTSATTGASITSTSATLASTVANLPTSNSSTVAAASTPSPTLTSTGFGFYPPMLNGTSC